MNSDITLNIIEEQRTKVFKDLPEINLVRPCRLNDGVIRHSDFEKNKYKIKFDNTEKEICFFIPASGSGSRMFSFLFNFLHNPNEESRSQTERFLNAIQTFAFFEMLPYDIKKRVREYDINLDELVSYILNEEGLNLGSLPKGLIPFHRSRSFILNAFQEQLLQGIQIKDSKVYFHFTINKSHEEAIQSALDAIQQLTGRESSIELSEQNPNTNSIAFEEDKNPLEDENGDFVTRPSGHGALLDNLNQIDKDIIFIKNIDNVQHESQATNTIDNLKYMGGLLESFKAELRDALQSEDKRAALALLNLQYQFTNPQLDFTKLTDEEIEKLIYRPIRICGMVPNEGQAGGGPFWEEKNGNLSKQIIEKAQISKNEKQYRLMVQGQYFNPVLMALSTKDIDGNKLDLQNFSDDEKYFIAEKTHKGKPIRFVERPGLWNGGMSDWLSVFVEIPTETFTPVKNVLDLLNKAHQEI
ncbi:MAG: DUF4301 family protein [Brumimicrobium sp.]